MLDENINESAINYVFTTTQSHHETGSNRILVTLKILAKSVRVHCERTAIFLKITHSGIMGRAGLLSNTS